MKFIKHTTWQEVFEGWRNRESHNPAWVQCATEIKGWPDWESWRKHSAEQIRAPDREWQVYTFTEPMKEIPAMLIGPYSGWQSRLSEKNTATFDDLLQIPEPYEEFRQHKGILSILKSLPFSTELIGIVRDDTNQIVCLEGHHRATAIALAKKQGKNIDFSTVEIKITLAHLPEQEIFLLDEMLDQGSSFKHEVKRPV